MLGGVRVVALSFSLISRLNKTESAVFYYTLGLVLLGGVRVVALSIITHEQTQ